jgi:hypothetical protein
MIGYWNFDEDSGSVAHDTSGSGYNGSVILATWTIGKINSALMFAGGSADDVVTPPIPVGNTFSVSVWVNSAVSTQTAYARIAETQYCGGFYLGALRRNSWKCRIDRRSEDLVFLSKLKSCPATTSSPESFSGPVTACTGRKSTRRTKSWSYGSGASAATSAYAVG